MHSGDSSSASNNILQSANSLDRVDSSKSNTQPSEWTNRIYSLGIDHKDPSAISQDWTEELVRLRVV